MKRSLFILLMGMWLVFPGISVPVAAQAQDPEAEPMVRPTAPPIATAVQIETAPDLDGEVSNDPVWQGVPASEGFWQTRPDEGQPASERTQVRIAYTKDTLYFGINCFDRDPSTIVVSDSRRDSPLDETDSFQIILDTYRDFQNGFVFGTNPAGIEYDGQLSNQGEGGGFGGGRQQSGAGGGFNLNWDGAWEVRAILNEEGWSAEFAIPFRTLRYPSGQEQVWGVNFQRNIRRRKETAFWAPLARQFNLFRLSDAGTLEGLMIQEQRNLKVTPYILGEARKRGDADTSWTGDFGIDAKYSITPSLTLDGTYNTDFAQVEVDEQQINLDRFNLFFPEKRPFFLENAGLFTVGSPSEVELFFSRRIGLSSRGNEIPIIAGGRVSGKVSRVNVGFLDMQTEGIEGLAPSNNFLVGRVSRELPNRSGIGGIFINRQGTGEFASDQDYNRTWGFDGRWGIGEYGELSGYYAGTSTPGLDGDAYAFNFGSRYDSPRWLLEGSYTELGSNFNPEVGFLSREGGYRKPSFLIFHRYRPDWGGLFELRPHVSYRGFWTLDGFQQTGYLHVDNHWEWRNGYEVHTGVNFTREGLEDPFEIYPGVTVPVGTYDHAEAQLVFMTNQGAPLSFSVRTVIGGFFGGDRFNTNPSMKLRVGETFNTELSWNYNKIDLPGGNFNTNLGRLRVSYSFTPRIYAQALVQYNDRADVWSVNFRVGWLQAANTGLFIVYNDTRGLGSFSPTELPDRSLVVKFSRLFDLLN